MYSVQCAHIVRPLLYTVSPTRTSNVFRMTSQKNLLEHIESDIFWTNKIRCSVLLEMTIHGMTKRVFEMQSWAPDMKLFFDYYSLLWNRQNWKNTLFFYLPGLRKVLLGIFLNGAWQFRRMQKNPFDMCSSLFLPVKIILYHVRYLYIYFILKCWQFLPIPGYTFSFLLALHFFCVLVQKLKWLDNWSFFIAK